MPREKLPDILARGIQMHMADRRRVQIPWGKWDIVIYDPHLMGEDAVAILLKKEASDGGEHGKIN